MLFKLCLMVFAVPGLLATTYIDEKYLEQVMMKNQRKEGHELERVKLIRLSPFDEVAHVTNRTRVELELVLKSGETHRKSVVVVDIPNDQRANIISKLGLMENDINVYSHVLPAMDQYLVQFPEDYQRNKMWLKAYDTQPNTRIVVEDVEYKQYYPHKPSEGLNMEHSKIALDALAKFHALGAVLKQKNIINVRPYDWSVHQKMQEDEDKWTRTVFSQFAKSIKSWGAEWQSAAEYFEKKYKTIPQELQEIYKRDDSKFNTLLSGYYCINNQYFKYDSPEKKTPVGVKTMTFQNAYYNSPAFDLQLFLNTSPEPEIMIDEARREELIHYYAQKMVEYLKKYGYEKNYTPEEFYDEYRRTELVGLSNAITRLEKTYQTSVNGEHQLDMTNPRYISVMKGLLAIARKHQIINY